MERTDLSAIGKETGMLTRMVGIYCRGKHGQVGRIPFRPPARLVGVLDTDGVALCGECARLLSYSLSMRLICPHDPKPSCKHCPTHCYKAGYRESIREVMRYSGWWLIRHGRVDLIRKMF